MRLAAHIAFYHVEDRMPYLEEVIRGLSEIPHDVDIFVYCNRPISVPSPTPRAKVRVVHEPFANVRLPRSLFRYMPPKLRDRLDPFLLTWRPRRHIAEMLPTYDAQAYLEDDIGFKGEGFDYWLKYKDLCLRHGYNLGFVRVEHRADDGAWLCTDLLKPPREVVFLEGQPFVVNDYPYSGFWVYDRDELAAFTRSKHWKFEDWEAHRTHWGVRARAAGGWYARDMERYRATLVPLERADDTTYVMAPACRVHHLPNNYIGHSLFCKIPFPIRGTVTRTGDGEEPSGVFEAA